MPENAPLYESLTVKEFLTFMAEIKGLKKKERINEINELIKELNLIDVEKKLIKNISKGYKQRVSLAGALIGKPEILILDEPTVGLDPKQIIEIRNLIKGLSTKHTVLISSHILSEISQICEKVIIINKGKIIAVDTPSNLENKINTNRLILLAEDNNNKIQEIKKEINEILEIKFIEEENNIKKYEILVKENCDIRKKITGILPDKNINLIEIRKAEITLEDAFINLIEGGGKK